MYVSNLCRAETEAQPKEAFVALVARVNPCCARKTTRVFGFNIKFDVYVACVYVSNLCRASEKAQPKEAFVALVARGKPVARVKLHVFFFRF